MANGLAAYLRCKHCAEIALHPVSVGVDTFCSELCKRRWIAGALKRADDHYKADKRYTRVLTDMEKPRWGEHGKRATGSTSATR